MDEKNALEELRMMSDRLHSEECVQDIVASDLTFVADRIEREWVELPKGADGVPINMGDTIYTEDGNMGDVIGIYFMQHKENVVCTLSDGRSIVRASHELSHEQPDSLGRIADELDEQAGSLTKDGYAWQEDAIHGFADRIRKLAAKEGK